MHSSRQLPLHFEHIHYNLRKFNHRQIKKIVLLILFKFSLTIFL